MRFPGILSFLAMIILFGCPTVEKDKNNNTRDHDDTDNNDDSKKDADSSTITDNTHNDLCPDRSNKNRCGGCGILSHNISESCGGKCGSAVYLCNENKTDVACVDPLENEVDLGTPCVGGICGTATYQCNDDSTAIVCTDPAYGSKPVGTICGKCNTGLYQCDETNSKTVCADPLANQPNVGDSCNGKCNTAIYQCSDDNADIVCIDPLVNSNNVGTACGGKCNTATYQCSNNKQDIVCVDPLASAFTPGDTCTPNGWPGSYQCTDNNTKISCIAHGGTHLWSQRFGDSLEQSSSGITTDNSGNIFITGVFYGSVDFGGGTLTSAGSADIFIAKFDTQWNHLWSKRFGDSLGQSSFSVTDQHSSGITTDTSGNIFITGNFRGSVDFGGGFLTSAGENDIFIAKFDGQGNYVWSKRFGDSLGQHSSGITTDNSGNIFITGVFYGSVDFGGGALISAGGSDIFIAKFDNNGNHLWSKRFGDTDYESAGSIDIDTSGNVFIIGYFNGSVNFGGGILTSAGSNDIFIAKFDNNGNHFWSKHFGGNFNIQYRYSITTDASGNVFITGNFYGTVDFGGGFLTSAGSYDIYIAELDEQGNHVWSQRFGDSNNQHGYSIITDARGNVFIAGGFEGSVDFGGGALISAGNWDIYLAKFDTQGNHVWSQRFGDSNDQSSNSITTDTSGNILIAGGFEGSVDFGGGILTSAGSADIFIAKFSP